MKFYVTKAYEIVDPKDEFYSLSEDQQTDILYDATDIWEKNFGRSPGGWPDVVVKRTPRSSLGEITA